MCCTPEGGVRSSRVSLRAYVRYQRVRVRQRGGNAARRNVANGSPSERGAVQVRLCLEIEIGEHTHNGTQAMLTPAQL